MNWAALLSLQLLCLRLTGTFATQKTNKDSIRKPFGLTASLKIIMMHKIEEKIQKRLKSLFNVAIFDIACLL